MSKEPRVERIRNIAVVSYTGAGKTSLAEAMLYTAGSIPAMGSTGTGTTASDFEPEEIHRKISISSSVLHFDWKDTTFNLLDTPGALSFLGEAKQALRAVDGVLIVVGASMGMRAELEKLWVTIQEWHLPCVLFINEMDKDRADMAPVLAAIEKALEVKALPVAIPAGQAAQLEGIVHLIDNAVYKSVAGTNKVQRNDVTPELAGMAGEARKRLVESVAEIEDRWVEKYLAQGDLSAEEITQGLKQATRARTLLPVLCGSAVRHVGIAALLDVLSTDLPSPVEAAEDRPLTGRDPHTGEDVSRRPSPEDPFSAYVFKTIIDPFVGHLTYVRVLSGTLEGDGVVYNATKQVKEKEGHVFTIFGKKYTQVPRICAGDIAAIGKLKETRTGDTLCDERHPIVYAGLSLPKPVLSFAIEPKGKQDIEKVSLGLHKLVEEDPTLEFTRNAETKEMVLSGMGQLHVDVTFEKLRRKYGVEVNIHVPKVPYKETIRRMAQAQGKYKKQTGGHGQFGDCWLQLDPLPRGKGFEFANKIVGGAIPRNFIPAVEKGVVEAMHEGALAGCPVVDLRVTVYDGSYHVVDSSEMSFKIAASMAFKKAMESANPVLLEPIMSVEITTPDDAVGAVIGDINGRRGRIVGVMAQGNVEIIKAAVPLAEMLKYAPTLISITGGRGTYGMEFMTYDELSRELAVKIMDEHKAAKHPLAS